MVPVCALSDFRLATDWQLAFDLNGSPHFKRRTIKGGSILFPGDFKKNCENHHNIVS